MKRIGNPLQSGRLLAVTALFGIALVAVVAVPLVAAADDLVSQRGRNAPANVEECRNRVGLEDPWRDGFLDELVTDEVISTDQAAEIDARLDQKHLDACIGRILHQRGNAIEATASVTGVEKREVLGALVAGESLSQFANDRGVDDAALINAIMADPETRAADLVAAGEMSQEDAERILGKIEILVGELIHKADIAPRRLGN